jgi:hypothetical protein
MHARVVENKPDTDGKSDHAEDQKEAIDTCKKK